ncbi:amino acid ABC transporter substrate-binding protein (PAAT family) [Chromohalobacter marismortui]|uniref:Amino acid ABC transporter substrate-binding protein (PAAT family) n=1 Tax=Chromohalobacter marismortui TaxID=42055 RepID=A0A4R7NSI7_9GAMM|nr:MULTISPECIES: transporter substrate-binding domain-containing protein [Chromohalobacter]MCI0509289.1 transporter substrate-binding domain-containing protein [Chromohalobacter sp.]MCI0593837.1 transporter substrate-binding domain-containing protein [Chromohalobacter sp.]TDU23818.1 amino acid ABC transporter substrate-binding protein (PAAT family) [Chromohalobacter marismortui]
MSPSRLLDCHATVAAPLKLAIAGLLVGVSLTGATSVLADDTPSTDRRSVRIAVDVPYPPFEYRKANGELAGFEIELGNALCRRAKLDCEWVVQGWDGIIPGLLARKYDAILSSMRITPARERQVRFTDPYAMSPKVWVAHTGHDISLDDPQSLSGLSVGIQRGTTQDNYVTQRYSDSLDIRRYNTAADVALDLQAERIDLAFINYPVALDTLNIGASDAQFVQVGPRINSPESIFGKGNAIAVRPRDEALAASFNQALDSVYADGTFVELMEKYFDYDLRPDARL